MKVEQVFYGRGMGGYAILGSSVSEKSLADEVQKLCQSVGTPGYERKDDDKPFLLQKPVGRDVIMVCGRNGEPDSVGRRTLFFHALIVPREYVLGKRISAYDVYRGGLFSEVCRSGSLEAVELPELSAGDRASDSDVNLPAVVRCRRAENLRVVDLFHGKLVETAWATISWSPLTGFDFYGLDEARSISTVHGNYRVYDVNGVMIRDLISDKHEVAEVPLVHKGQMKAGLMKPIVFGLIGGALGLTAGWVFWGGSQQEPIDRESMTAEIEARVKEELGPKMKAEAAVALRKELEKDIRTQLEKEFDQKTAPKANAELPVFDEQYRLVDFKKQMAELDRVWKVAMIEHRSGLEKERRLFEKIQWYVDFVNDNFPKKER